MGETGLWFAAGYLWNDSVHSLCRTPSVHGNGACLRPGCRDCHPIRTIQWSNRDLNRKNGCMETIGSPNISFQRRFSPAIFRGGGGWGSLYLFDFTWIPTDPIQIRRKWWMSCCRFAQKGLNWVELSLRFTALYSSVHSRYTILFFYQHVIQTVLILCTECSKLYQVFSILYHSYLVPGTVSNNDNFYKPDVAAFIEVYIVYVVIVLVLMTRYE